MTDQTTEDADPTRSIAGHCPACHSASLTTAAGGHLTCTRLDCTDPTAADDLLHGHDPAGVRAAAASLQTITATYATHSPSHARAVLSAIAGSVTGAVEVDAACTGARVEIETDAAVLPVNVDDLADRIAARLRQFDREDAEAPPAADGSDDQDGPVLRARPYLEIGRLSELTTWANRDHRWWYAGVDQFTDTGAEVDWLPGAPERPDALFRLPGWVEIPQATTGDTATSKGIDLSATPPCPDCGHPAISHYPDGCGVDIRATGTQCDCRRGFVDLAAGPAASEEQQ